MVARSVVFAVALACPVSSALEAQEPSPDASEQVQAASAADREDPPRGPWWTGWSWASPHDRLIVVMTSAHLYELEEGWTENGALGLIAGGFFGASFITTHGPRGWVLGVERAWLEGSWGPARTMLGFRAGLVYGYDERLGSVAGAIPILPYAQPLAMLRLGPASLDLAYSWVVVSLTGGLTLW
jgi:hypothetical protein